MSRIGSASLISRVSLLALVATLTPVACTAPLDEPAAGDEDEAIATAQEALTIGSNIFYDGFDGTALNRGNWNVQQSNQNDACRSDGAPFNGELQRYQDREGCSLTDHNICVSNGTLKLVVRRQDGTACNGSYAKYTSARINSKRKREFNPWQGGAGVRIEARIRMPAGVAGVWPAFWTLGDDIKQGPRMYDGTDDNDWPDVGEIDIAEAGWNWGGGSTSLNTLHYGTGNWSASDGQYHASKSGGSTGIGRYEWHTYAVEWTPGAITWFKDGIASGNVTGSVALNFSGQDFEHDHFILLNFAMGGAGGGSASAADSYFPKSGTDYKWEQVLEVDYVRVDRLETGTAPPPPPPSGGCTAGSTVAIRAVTNSMYASAQSSDGRLLAKASAIGTWEKFTIVDAGGGLVALRAHTNNRYVSADLNLADKTLRAAWDNGVGTWEKFQFVAADDGTYGIKASANNLFVSADRNLTDTPLNAKWATTIGGWEQFTCVAQ